MKYVKSKNKNNLHINGFYAKYGVNYCLTFFQ